MKSTSQKIPESLVYEIYNGKPIHYKGYKDVLNGSKTLEEIMGSSIIQSLLIAKLIVFLGKKISDDFHILTNEVGLNLGKKSLRAADIAIVTEKQLEEIEDDNKILNTPPKYVIEVDIKASTDDIGDTASYYHKKTDELLEFGVEHVFWIFTSSKKIMIAEKGKKNWTMGSWDDTPIEIEGIKINLEELTAKKKKK